jgi:hypothetical protein
VGTVAVSSESSAVSRRPVRKQRNSRKITINNTGDLGRRFGVKVAEKRLNSRDPGEELRAVQRLARIGTEQSFDILLRHKLQDPHAKLELVRSLLPYRDNESALKLVIQQLTNSISKPSATVGTLIRDTAAITLAKWGKRESISALGGFVRQGGQAAEAAQLALLAYPPQRLDWLLGEHAAPSAYLSELLGKLGDMRALPYLRSAMRSTDTDTRLRTLLAMARLGDAQSAMIARTWVNIKHSQAQLISVQVLCLLSPSEGRTELAKLLKNKKIQHEALDLAKRSPGPELVAGLTPLLQQPETRQAAIVALSRSGPAGVQALIPLLEQPNVAHIVAHSLALSRAKEARLALEKALTSSKTRALAIRAGVVREQVLHDSLSGMSSAIKQALQGNSSEQSAAQFAQVALGKHTPTIKEITKDSQWLATWSRAILAEDPNHIRTWLPILAKSPADKYPALALALLEQPDGGSLSSETLLIWLEEGSARSPLAARALAIRDNRSLRARLVSLMTGGDPQIRAHIALGWAQSSDSSAAGRLADAYRTELNTSAREAIVRGLAQRKEGIAQRALYLAAAVDPSTTIRATAQSARKGRSVPLYRKGNLISWVQVQSNSPKELAVNSAFRWQRPDGLVVPVYPDNDGTLMMPGLPGGLSEVTLALQPASTEPAKPPSKDLPKPKPSVQNQPTKKAPLAPPAATSHTTP